MKTANFEYTDMSEVDSSFARAVYYNTHTRELAISLRGPYSPTVIYEDVPVSVFTDLVDSDSVGSTYNQSVKSVYRNVSDGTVYDVKFSAYEEPEVKTYTVHGFVEFTATFIASSPREAAEKFAREMNSEGFRPDTVKIKEVSEYVD
jgi:hypothetical protein